MSNTLTLDLELIKDRACWSVSTAGLKDSDVEYERAIQFQADHFALIEEVERLRAEVEERRTESSRCTCYNDPDCYEVAIHPRFPHRKHRAHCTQPEWIPEHHRKQE